MILFPAIDLKDGQAVRLLRGEMDAATVFNDDPAAQGKAFVEAGAEWLQLYVATLVSKFQAQGQLGELVALMEREPRLAELIQGAAALAEG